MQTSINRVSGQRQARPGLARGRPAARMTCKALYLESERGSGAAPSKFANQLEALRSMSVVVADTGEPELVKLHKPGETSCWDQWKKLRLHSCMDVWLWKLKVKSFTGVRSPSHWLAWSARKRIAWKLGTFPHAVG